MELSPSRIVAIGYSAGGLEPCLDLIGELKAGSRQAYVILPHLAREYVSQLSSILQKRTPLPVTPIHHGGRLNADTIHVLPPNQWAYLRGETFRLVPRPPIRLNCCITEFLTSLASELGPRSVGVILSGSAVGAEGATGIDRIKSVGGTTFAQDPATATFPHMPQQAIGTGQVDHVLPAAEIGRVLARCGDATPSLGAGVSGTPIR